MCCCIHACFMGKYLTSALYKEEVWNPSEGGTQKKGIYFLYSFFPLCFSLLLLFVCFCLVVFLLIFSLICIKTLPIWISIVVKSTRLKTFSCLPGIMQIIGIRFVIFIILTIRKKRIVLLLSTDTLKFCSINEQRWNFLSQPWLTINLLQSKRADVLIHRSFNMFSNKEVDSEASLCNKRHIFLLIFKRALF